jgi:uncharacterized cupin superfamily protein
MTTSGTTSGTTRGTRSVRFVDALTARLEPTDLDADQVIAGEPATAAASFADLGTADVGVWEHTPGVSIDVEVDEVFVVLSGRGTVTFDTGETVELVPGRLVRLNAGEGTRWDVRETVRKVYLAC